MGDGQLVKADDSDRPCCCLFNVSGRGDAGCRTTAWTAPEKTGRLVEKVGVGGERGGRGGEEEGEERGERA